jgi:hypothetical protein
VCLRGVGALVVGVGLHGDDFCVEKVVCVLWVLRMGGVVVVALLNVMVVTLLLLLVVVVMDVWVG